MGEHHNGLLAFVNRRLRLRTRVRRALSWAGYFVLDDVINAEKFEHPELNVSL